MNYYYDKRSNNTEVENKEKSTAKKPINEIYEWIDAIVISVIAIILIFTFAFRVVGIEGHSMEDTLFDNDRVIISNLFYTPKQNDVVVISRNYTNKTADKDDNDAPIIKRVIAVGGQKVTIDPTTGQVSVDDIPLEEDYIKPGQITTWEDGSTEAKTVLVEKDHVFVMGDNRGNSLDSRFEVIGQVDVRYILGHALCRIYPSIGGL